jgi:hypothetical protein
MRVTCDALARPPNLGLEKAPPHANSHHPEIEAMRLPPVYMVTCLSRQAVAQETLYRWTQTDWGTAPELLMDADPELPGEEWSSAQRSTRLTSAFHRALQQVVHDGSRHDEWVLFLEDDLDFHPRIGSFVKSWPAMEDLRCGMASLFDPILHRCELWVGMERAFAAEAGTSVGAQALLLRHWAAELAVADWNTVAGTHSQRLVKLLAPLGPIWIHRPSLVRPVEADPLWAIGNSKHWLPAAS